MFSWDFFFLLALKHVVFIFMYKSRRQFRVFLYNISWAGFDLLHEDTVVTKIYLTDAIMVRNVLKKHRFRTIIALFCENNTIFAETLYKLLKMLNQRQ